MINVINKIISNDNLTTIVCTCLGLFSFLGTILIIFFKLYSKKNTIRFESRLKLREERFDEFITAAKELVLYPNKVFEESYIKELFARYFRLKIFIDNNLDKTILDFVNGCQLKFKHYKEKCDKGTWSVKERIESYRKDGLIEDGTNIYELEYKIEKDIDCEKNAYEKDNIFDDSDIQDILNSISNKMRKILNSLS